MLLNFISFDLYFYISVVFPLAFQFSLNHFRLVSVYLVPILGMARPLDLAKRICSLLPFASGRAHPGTGSSSWMGWSTEERKVSPTRKWKLIDAKPAQKGRWWWRGQTLVPQTWLLTSSRYDSCWNTSSLLFFLGGLVSNAHLSTL